MAGKHIVTLFGPESFLFGDYYNKMVLDGLVTASKKFRLAFDLVISPTRDRIQQDMESCIKVGRYATMIAVGNVMQEPTVKCAAKFPDMRFVLIDGSAEGIPNVVSYSSDPSGISLLCGQVAMRISPAPITGCILWSDNWVARQWITSFILGAKLMKPSSKVFYSFAGNAEEAYQKATRQFDEGAEIIMCHAGSADLGIIRAARGKDKYVLGFLNERGIDPDRVLFDVTREMGPIVLDAIARTSALRFKGGKLIRMGLKEGSLGIDLRHAHERIGRRDKVMINQMISQIKHGKFDSKLVNFENRSMEDVGGTLL